MLEDEVEQMEKCRLKGDNLGFYRHKYRAESVMDRPSVKYSLVLADYLVQTGNRKEAREVMHSLASDDRLSLNGDTLLWLDYLCHQQKRIGVMISKIGASKAISVGAYDFALAQLDA